MQIKKEFDEMIIFFNVLGNTVDIEKIDILENSLLSAFQVKLIKRDKPFNEMIKLQQKYSKHIIVDYEIGQFDDFRLLVRIVKNFLRETSQVKFFSLDRIELKNENGLIMFEPDLLRIPIGEKATISPVIRSCWLDPNLIEKIFRK